MSVYESISGLASELDVTPDYVLSVLYHLTLLLGILFCLVCQLVGRTIVCLIKKSKER